jgi:DNA repair protein RadA/Sms
VLEKRIGLNLSKQDVYVNVIGGIEVSEPAADLGIALAIITCVRDVVFDSHTAIVGEIGLSGEARAVSQPDLRLKESAKLGFERAMIPPRRQTKNKQTDIKIMEVGHLKTLVDLFTGGQ